MKKGRKKRIVLIAAVLIAVFAAGAYAFMRSGAVAADTVAAGRGAVTERIEETGVIASRQVSVVLAKSNYDVTSVLCATGDTVEAGATLMTTDIAVGDSDVKSLEAQAAGVEAQLAQARQNVGRLWSLYESGAVSRNEYDTAETLEKELAAGLQSLRYTIRSMRENAPANRVEAPRSGVVTELFVSEGDTAVMGAPLAEIADMSDLYIRVSLQADDAAKIRVGDRVILTDRPDVSCRVEKISPKVREEMSELGITQKRVDAEISADDWEGFVLGGDADVEIVIEEREDVIFAPRKAVFSLNGADFVYTVQEGRAALRQVEVGLKGKDFYEIRANLAEGESVIVSPDEAITDGSRIVQTQN
ncbi:MAG: efflux RND transporter periplasmic adaptor subunit [Clostridiales Family XIII bacterium]|jgi:HlyD family secretion protein|nr:efflux RND transporter periplasmic adaptor subunit [Clostridiales Family XIII bacterium]